MIGKKYCFIKNGIIFLCVSVMCLQLSGCYSLEATRYKTIDECPYIETTDIKESYPNDFKTINIGCKSISKRTCSYYYSFDEAFEVKIDDEWKEIDYTVDSVSLGAAVYLRPGEEFTFTIKREEYNYDFPPGEYRFILNFEGGIYNKKEDMSTKQKVFYFTLK